MTQLNAQTQELEALKVQSMQKDDEIQKLRAALTNNRNNDTNDTNDNDNDNNDKYKGKRNNDDNEENEDDRTGTDNQLIEARNIIESLESINNKNLITINDLLEEKNNQLLTIRELTNEKNRLLEDLQQLQQQQQQQQQPQQQLSQAQPAGISNEEQQLLQSDIEKLQRQNATLASNSTFLENKIQQLEYKLQQSAVAETSSSPVSASGATPAPADNSNSQRLRKEIEELERTVRDLRTQNNELYKSMRTRETL